MNNKDKSILQIHHTDEFILPYIVEESLLEGHLAVQKTEDIIHNARYNRNISVEDTYIDIKISGLLITKSMINLN